MCHNPLDRIRCKIVSNHLIAPGIYDMTIEASDLCELVRPGQFVNLYCNTLDKLLPRPISICEVDKNEGLLRLVYAELGAGTKAFTGLTSTDHIEVLGPLGNGFTTDIYDIDRYSEVLIVGGGVGTPPLLELSKELKRYYQDKIKLTIVLGFREDEYLIEDFKRYGEVFVATDSGKTGYHGNVVGLMNEMLSYKLGTKSFEQLYACGPTPMLKALQGFCEGHSLQGQFSLEERMGCGFGGCVGCVVPIKQGEDFEYKKVCKDGPVFPYSEVIFK